MNLITPDEIDFSLYERESEAQRKVKPASHWVQELVDRIKSPVREHRTVMPWRKTHSLIAFRPGEVTLWGGANGNGKSLVTGQVGLSLCAQDEKVCIASFEMKPLKTLERMARQWSTYNPNDPAFRGHPEAMSQFIDIYEQFRDWTDDRLWLTSTTFQLYKRYTDAASTRYKQRKITRPKASTFVVSVSGVPLDGASYSLNANTGVVTIPSAPTASTVTWTGRFYVPVHFQSDEIDWTMVSGGQYLEARLVSGPSVVLEEVRE